MAPLRSLGNIRSAFDDFYARTGKDAVTPSPPPIISSGGTKIEDGNNVYHVFTYPNSDTFTSNTAVSAYYLVVAGGGTGGTNSGGGGGAGGAYSNHPDVPSPIRQSALNIVAGTTYPITVGNYSGNSAIGPSVITATAGGAGGNTDQQMVVMVVPVVVEVITIQIKAPLPVLHLHQGKEILVEDRWLLHLEPQVAAVVVDGVKQDIAQVMFQVLKHLQLREEKDFNTAGRALPSLPAPLLAPAIPAPERSAWTAAVGPTGFLLVAVADTLILRTVLIQIMAVLEVEVTGKIPRTHLEKHLEFT